MIWVEVEEVLVRLRRKRFLNSFLVAAAVREEVLPRAAGFELVGGIAWILREVLWRTHPIIWQGSLGAMISVGWCQCFQCLFVGSWSQDVRPRIAPIPPGTDGTPVPEGQRVGPGAQPLSLSASRISAVVRAGMHEAPISTEGSGRWRL